MIPNVKRIRVAGIPVDHVSEENFEEIALFLSESEEFHQIIFLSLWDLLRARRDKEFRLCVERASLIIPVSRGILAGARFLRKTVPARYMPFDFVIRMLGALETRGRSLYLLGAKNQDLRNVDQNLRQTFPGIKVVGRYTGYYPRAMERNIITAIKKASPHFVLVGPGIRGKDKWIYRNKKEFSRGVFLWNSPVMEIIAGRRRKVSREAFRKGREFLPELARRPWRVFRCLLYAYYGLLLVIYRLRKA